MISELHLTIEHGDSTDPFEELVDIIHSFAPGHLGATILHSTVVVDVDEDSL